MPEGETTNEDSDTARMELKRLKPYRADADEVEECAFNAR